MEDFEYTYTDKDVKLISRLSSVLGFICGFIVAILLSLII